MSESESPQVLRTAKEAEELVAREVEVRPLRYATLRFVFCAAVASTLFAVYRERRVRVHALLQPSPRHATTCLFPSRHFGYIP